VIPKQKGPESVISGYS